MLDSLTQILVALTAAALIIAGTRTPGARRPDVPHDAASRRGNRPTTGQYRDDSTRFVAVRNAWDRADLARAIGTDNAVPEYTNAPHYPKTVR